MLPRSCSPVLDKELKIIKGVELVLPQSGSPVVDE